MTADLAALAARVAEIRRERAQWEAIWDRIHEINQRADEYSRLTPPDDALWLRLMSEQDELRAGREWTYDDDTGALLERIAALEGDNKRLRAALESIATTEIPWTKQGEGHEGDYMDLMRQEARDALRQAADALAAGEGEG